VVAHLNILELLKLAGWSRLPGAWRRGGFW